MAAALPDRKVSQLQRQFAYDRLLARVFSTDDAETWVLKGAGALLARLSTARHSADIDLYRRRDELPQAEEALRVAAARDLGDHFSFELSSTQILQQAGAVRRIPVIARLAVASTRASTSIS